MIRTITHIKSFGVFSNFRWPTALPHFKRYNLFYGWNYSGKTTLSRIFRCFEQQQLHPDFPSAEVQMAMADGAVHDFAGLNGAPVLRVFNTDFIRENLQFDTASAHPLLVLGAEDIAKQRVLDDLRRERDLTGVSIVESRRRHAELTGSLEKALTKAARDTIKNPLGIPNYDKTRFLPKVKECAAAGPKKYLLDSTVLGTCLSVYAGTEKRPLLDRAKNTLTPISIFHDEVRAVLATVVIATKPIARLQQDADIEQWVSDGRALHQGKPSCQFCGQPLPKDLLGHLAEHFSQQYDDLMAKVGTLESRLENGIKEQIALNAKAELYQDFQVAYAAVEGKLETAMNTRKSSLRNLGTALTTKRSKAFSMVNCPPLSEATDEIISAVEELNGLISRHNARTNEFDKRKQETFEKLELHHAAIFARDNKYRETLENIDKLKEALDKLTARLSELESKIRLLEKELSEVSKGANQINDLLAAYFGKDDLRIEVSTAKAFQIVRGKTIAKNLSEGEKTAIAFAYFITRVHDGRMPLSDTRIVVDDPISSLDSNHLFNTYALIKTQLADCRQLFISTHSFEFYTLIRDWAADDVGKFDKPQMEWKDWSIYFVRRTDGREASIEEVPRELLRFRSEYHYLFATLYHFDKEAKNDFNSLLSLPNITRRFMEAFGGIMIPLHTGLKGKMERLFPNKVERERVWKFMNYYSHNTTVTLISSEKRGLEAAERFLSA